MEEKLPVMALKNTLGKMMRHQQIHAGFPLTKSSQLTEKTTQTISKTITLHHLLPQSQSVSHMDFAKGYSSKSNTSKTSNKHDVYPPHAEKRKRTKAKMGKRSGH